MILTLLMTTKTIIIAMLTVSEKKLYFIFGAKMCISVFKTYVKLLLVYNFQTLIRYTFKKEKKNQGDLDDARSDVEISKKKKKFVAAILDI